MSKKKKKENDRLAEKLVSLGKEYRLPQLQQPKDDNDYLSVSFQYLQKEYNLDRRNLTKDNKIQLLKKLALITQMTWTELILKDKKHGFEILDKKVLNKNIPTIITEDLRDIYILRFASQDCRLVGIRQDNIFQILYIDPDLSLYKH